MSMSKQAACDILTSIVEADGLPPATLAISDARAMAESAADGLQAATKLFGDVSAFMAAFAAKQMKAASQPAVSLANGAAQRRELVKAAWKDAVKISIAELPEPIRKLDTARREANAKAAELAKQESAAIVAFLKSQGAEVPAGHELTVGYRYNTEGTLSVTAVPAAGAKRDNSIRPITGLKFTKRA